MLSYTVQVVTHVNHGKVLQSIVSVGDSVYMTEKLKYVHLSLEWNLYILFVSFFLSLFPTNSFPCCENNVW